jgi:hypothetical protein
MVPGKSERLLNFVYHGLLWDLIKEKGKDRIGKRNLEHGKVEKEIDVSSIVWI